MEDRSFDGDIAIGGAKRGMHCSLSLCTLLVALAFWLLDEFVHHTEPAGVGWADI